MHHNVKNGGTRDQRVTDEEFVEYYTNVSASIDDDLYFQAMMNAAWNLSGDASSYKQYGKGWASEDTSSSKGGRGNSSSNVGGGYQRKNVDPDGNPT